MNISALASPEVLSLWDFESHCRAAGSPQRPVQILLVDDDRADALLCAALLERTGLAVKVDTQLSGVDGIEAAARKNYDSVLLDFHLPDGTAAGLTERIKIAAGDRFLPVVVMSGRSDEDTVLDAIHHGAADYLPKDRMTPAALRRTLENAIEKSTLERELAVHRSGLIAANEELRRQNREIQSFYHTVSHELKTPLTAIREFNALLYDGVLGAVNDEQREALQTSVQCCDQLTRMVNDLFDAARIETGKVSLDVRELDLTELLRQEVEIMQSTARSAGVVLVAKLQKSLPSLRVDQNRIAQLIFNLVGNAIKFTPAGGRVEVRLEHDSAASCCRVSVADSGCGIPKEQLHRVFDRLYQVSEGDETLSAGLGVGLYLCRQIVVLHGGEVFAESSLGAGSVFSFTLPIPSAAVTESPLSQTARLA